MQLERLMVRPQTVPQDLSEIPHVDRLAASCAAVEMVFLAVLIMPMADGQGTEVGQPRHGALSTSSLKASDVLRIS